MKNHENLVKKFTVIIILIMQVFTLTSCVGNKKQIQKLYLVVAMGVDLTADNQYEVTIQVLNPAVSSNQASGTNAPSSSGGETLVYGAKGTTFNEAVMELSKSMRKVHHFGHLKYIVIGEHLAQNRNLILTDSFFRQEEIRLNTPILVTKGSASEIVSATTSEGVIPANVVSDLFERQILVGYRPYTYLLDLVNALGSKTVSPVLGVINLVKPEDKHGAETFKLSGGAVFKKGKLVGYLNDKETRGLNWIRGKIEVGNLTANCPNLGKVSLEILDTSSKIKPKINEDTVSIEINIKVISIIRGVSTPIDPVKNTDIMDEIESAQKKTVEEEVRLVLGTARENLSADIFGFGEKVHASYPSKWKTLEKDWDTIYPNMNVDIVIDSRVRRTGSILKSVEID
jgi:spore germination protein KC